MKKLISVGKKLALLLKEVKQNAMFALIILIFKGITEGVGLLFIIPLLSVAGVSNLEESNSQLAKFIQRSFEHSGVSLSVVNVLIIYFLIMSFYALLKYIQAINSMKINQRVIVRWQNAFFRQVTYASWSSIQNVKGSDLQEILTSQIKRFGAISNQTIQMVGALVIIGVYLTLSLMLSFKLTVLSLIPIGLLVLLNRPINKKTYSLGEVAVKFNKSMQALILEHLLSLKLVKSYRKEKEHLETFQERSYSAENQSVLFVKTSGKTKLFFEVLAAVIVVIYIYFALEVLAIEITEVLLLIFIFAKLLPKVSLVIGNFQQILNHLPAFETTLKTLSKLKNEEQIADQKTLTLLQFQQKIRFDSVGFAYGDNQVLSKLNFSIYANKTTIILGSSGAGKSTVVDLILGLQKPSEGKIFIDDLPLTSIQPNYWKDQIAYVPQDSFLFHVSILENLLWAKPDATQEDINRALKQSGAYEFITKLPEGLKTIVGDRGTKLSGGERQRIALARGLIRQPKLLILDEATNAVDDKNEGLIKEALSQLSGKMTIIIVAHRSKLVELADNIIEL